MEQGQSNIPNLLGMARTAVEAGNDDEAIAYFNRVLEADPTISEAWLGKGRAVARLSSLKHVRIRETATAFGNAIGSAPEADRPNVRDIALAELVTFGTQLHRMNLTHGAMFQNVPGTAEQEIATALAIIEALELGLRWAPHFRPALDLAIIVCASALGREPGGGRTVLFQQKLDGFRGTVRAIDPEYAAAQDAAEAREVAQAEERAAAVASQKKTDQYAMFIGLAIAVIAAVAFLALT